MITKYHQFINESKNDAISELNQDKIGIILMGTPGLGKTHFNKNYIQKRKEIKTFSTDNVSLKFTKDPNKYYAEDLFHPSDEGYQFWFDQIQIFYPPKLS